VCASFVSGKGKAVDVGTDHAFLSVFLVQSGKCSEVIACDVNERPLRFAEKTVETYKASDKIMLVLSDGLKNISPEGVTDVIIAGMGGELISRIISEAQWLKNGVNLILQPMTKAEILRKQLSEIGFDICREQAASDDGFTYTVIQSVYCGEYITRDELYLYRGKISSQDSEGRKYLRLQAERLKKIADGLSKSTYRKFQSEKYYALSEKLIAEVGNYD